ncbi:FAD/NAD(P)-binding domain-containing protein [Rhizodiscina lignyota]|uniref:FAD/NAD(P)-binding domain-containing protein n=1 Tax=Rhizodiscina lignyota TaxID=1504668 RepID=A0A9P4I718_9PEZI|nr:FAD/NAD(P)-binding domain-containing protein [Rhizodiscina lignyota]
MKHHKFHVAIIGAGLGGLAAAIGIAKAGHRVTIIERAPALAEIGAGIQIPPNSTRILKQWGILENVESLSDRPEEFIFRSYRDGKVLSSVNLPALSEGKYGQPYLHIHRADYHEVLVQELYCLGGKVQLNSEVTGIDFNEPAIHIKGLPDVFPDIIIGADGLKSKCRDSLLGRSNPPVISGDMAYRCIIKAEKMKQNPILADLVQSHDLHYWIGPGQHIVCYKLRAGDLFNIVIACTDTLPETTDMSPADINELRARVTGWDPKLQALLELAEQGGVGRLMRVDEMETWIHSSGKFALLGDACHSTLPYIAQGAAQAIEDGAVLGHLFEKISQPSQLCDLLVIYEALRKSRTSRVVKAATHGRRVLHLPDGPLQEERDRQLLEETPFEGFPHPWADPVMQEFLYGYDAQKEVDRAWERYLSGTFPSTTAAWRSAMKAEL